MCFTWFSSAWILMCQLFSTYQLCKGVIFSHEYGFLHKDLKLRNNNATSFFKTYFCQFRISEFFFDLECSLFVDLCIGIASDSHLNLLRFYGVDFVIVFIHHFPTLKTSAFFDKQHHNSTILRHKYLILGNDSISHTSLCRVYFLIKFVVVWNSIWFVLDSMLCFFFIVSKFITM